MYLLQEFAACDPDQPLDQIGAISFTILEGERDPAVLAELCRCRLRSKIPKLTEALTGRFNEHHGFPARLHLNLIDQHSPAIEELTCRIEGCVPIIMQIPRVN